MRSSPGLATTQRWLQAVIMAPGTNEEAIQSGAAASGINPKLAEALALPSRTLTAAERVGIYRGMYEARLRDALRVDYPLLAAFLGEDRFAELAELYLEEHPSRSYTLNRLGDHLPEFLKEVDGLPRPAFVRDLARYELALTEVFDAPETKPIEPEDLEKIPTEAWERARLKPVAAFRLMGFRYPVSEYARMVREKPETGAPRRKDTPLAIFRHNYALRSLELTKPAYQILESLASGETLGEAIRTSRAPQSPLFEWFRTWVSEGIFQSVTV